MLKKTLSIFSRSKPFIFPSQSLVDLNKFYFARRIKSKPSKFESDQEEDHQSKSESDHESDPEIEKIPKKDIMDPKSDEIDEKWLAQCYLPPQQLPKPLLDRCQKVFSKFPQAEIRKIGTVYLKLYQALHASEKPTDLSKIRPFANTSEMTATKGSLIYLGRKRRNEDPDEAGPKKDKPKKQKPEEEENILKPEEKADAGLEYDQNFALAYLQRKMPHTFGVASRVMSELKYRLPEFEPKTFLDYGAGLGSGSYAFSNVFQKFDKIIAIEPSAPMRKLGKYLTEDIKKIAWFDTLARIVNVHDIDGQFDVVYCGYVLEEAKNADARLLIIESLWQKVRPGGIMILVEPGSPKGYRFVNDFRNWIVEKPRTDANIVAPCPHHDECPMAKQAHVWCNFEASVFKYPNKIFAKLPKQSTMDREKFSFLAVKKGPVPKGVGLTPAEQSFGWGRIIKKVLRRKGHAIFDICNKAGKLEKKIIAKSHGKEGYKEAKRLRWGDLWYLPDRIPNKFRKEGLKTERLW